MLHYKNAHKNEKVFMVGSGPSLTYDMLDRLQDQNTIAMNNIAIAFDKTKWRPTYYVNVSQSLRKDGHWQKYGAQAIDDAQASFLWAKHATVPLKYRCSGKVVFVSATEFPVWSRNPDDWISRYGSSMFAATQIADYMGFNPIYYIGCDLGFYNSVSDDGEDRAHFDPRYLGDMKIGQIEERKDLLLVDELRTYDSHRIANIYLSKNRRVVKTCSPGSLSDIYEYVPFEVALKERHNFDAILPN
jgi:hypothetical protein